MSGPEQDSTGARILDAATRMLVDVGLCTATVELTAEYAGVSSRAIYRRWPDKAELLRAVIRRELSLVVDRAFGEVSAEDSFDDVVTTAFTAIVWTVYDHPLARELTADPDTVLPIVTAESGPVLDALVVQVAEKLAAAAVARDRLLVDPEALADVVVRLAQALVLVPDSARPVTGRDDIERYARRHLRPIARSATISTTAEHAEPPEPAAIGAGRRRLFRRAHLQLAPPIALALLVSSGALAAALVQPWSAPVTPNILNDSGSAPASHSDGQTAPEQDTVSPSPMPSPSAVAVPSPAAPITAPAQTSAVLVDVFQRVEAPASSSAVPNRESPPPPRPPLPPPPLRKPLAPPALSPASGVASRPGLPPGPAGAAPSGAAPSGSAQHPAGHGGGIH